MSRNKKSRNSLNEEDIALSYQLLNAMKSKDVNIASWLIVFLTISVGSIKLFTEEYFDFFEHIGKEAIINENVFGILMIIFGIIFAISIIKPRIGKIPIGRISIILVTCSWTYLAFEYLMITIFINTGIVWIMSIGIISICFYVMVRGEYD